MATQPQGRYFSPEQLQSIQSRIQAEREAEAAQQEYARQRTQRAITQDYLNRDRSFGQVAGDTGLALLQGAVDLGSAAYGIGNIATLGGLEAVTGMSENFERTDAILEDSKSDQLRYQKMMAGQAFEDSLVSGAAAYITNPGLLSDLLVRSAPSIAPGAAFGATAARTAAAGATARGATAAQAGQTASRAAARAATGATAAQTGGMSYTEAYNQAINEGLSPEEARTRAYGAAAIVAPATAATMAIPGLGPAGVEGQVLARLFGGEAGSTVRSGMGVARGVVDATGREALQETLQGTSEQFAQNLVSTERNIDDNLGQAAVLSAIAGGAMGLGVGALRAPGELRESLDNLRTQSAENLGNPDLGLSEVERNDARVQGTDIPAYIRAQRMGRVQRGRDLLGDPLQASGEEIVADETPLPASDFEAEARETGQGTLFGPDVPGLDPLPEVSEEVDLADTPLPEGSIPLPNVAEASPQEIEAARQATLPRVREIESERLTDAEEAIQIMELFNPGVRQELAQGLTNENAVVLAVQNMRARGVLPPRQETESGRALFESVATPSTGITEQDLISAPTDTPASKAFKAYQRRVAERGQPAPAETAVAGSVRTVRTPISQVIDRAVGVSGGGTVSEADILSGEEAYIAEQYGEPARIDANGDPVYQQYDPNLQTMVDLPYQQVREEAAEFVRQRTGEPSTLFKSAMAQEFDLPENTALRGKAWNAFAEAVDAAGVRPTDENVAAELVTIAQNLDGNGLPSSKFYNAFMNKYGPGSDIARSFEPKPKKTKKKAPEPKQGDTFTGRDWKQSLAKRLGLKPSQMRGKAWNTFDEMVRDRNIGPTDPNAEGFLQEVSEAIDAPPESAPVFAATLRTAYPVQEEVVVEPTPEEDLAPAETSEATEALEGLSQPEEIDPNVQMRVDYFRNRFMEEADGIRSQWRSDAKAKPEITDLLQKMVNEVTYPEDIPELARAIVPNLEFRSYTPKQRVDAFYRPLADVAKRMMGDARTSEELTRVMGYADEVFGDRSQLPDRSDNVDARSRLMPIDKELAEYYAERLDMLLEDPANQNNTMKFSRAGTGTKAEGDPISQSRFQQAVDRANRIARPGEKQVVGYDTVADAERALGIPMPKDANGVYYNGEAAVIRENITSTEQLADAMLHERAHGGLEGLLGADRLRAVQNRLWANNALRSRIKTKMETHQLTRQDAAEEVLVDMIVGGEKINKSIFSKIRAAVNRTAEILAGVGGYAMTDSQVEALLRDTVDYMQGGRTYREGPLGGYTDGLAEYEAAVRGDITPMSPKFSIATNAFERATSIGQISGNAMKQASTTLADAVRTAVEEKTFKPLEELFPQAGRLPRWALNFAPLRAIANHYRGLMNVTKTMPDGTEVTVDTLREQANNSRRKEVDFNKTLHETRARKYRGPDGEETLEFSNQGLAEEWAAFRGKNPNQAGILDKLNNRATTYKLHPDREWEQQSKPNYERLPYTEQERREQFEILRREWQQMGETGRSIYKKSQASYNQMWTDRYEELRNTILRESGIDRLKVDPETGQTVRNSEWVRKWNSIIDTAISKLSEGPYSPLQRHGDYFVTVRDADGGVLSFMAFDTEREAMVAKRHINDTKTDDTIQVQYSVRKTFDRAMDGMNRKVYENMERALEATFPAGPDGVADQSFVAAKEALKSVYLAGLEDSHILKHGIKRKFVDGASLDTLRAFTSYTLKSARSLSSLRWDHRIEDNLRDMENAIDPNGPPQRVTTQRNVYDAVRKQHRATLEYEQNRLSEITTQIAYVNWLTSPSQMALNASQTALVTVPRLAAKYSVPGAGKAIGQATAKFMGTRFRGMHDPDSTTLDKNSPHYQVMRELFDRGVLDFTLSHDMSGIAKGDSFGMNGVMREGLRRMSWFMHSSEVMNREIASYAATELELQSNPQLAQDLQSDNEQVRRRALEQLTDVAEDMVDTTQFDYSMQNKPANLQGPIARVVFQFQQFRINMLAMMATDIKRAFQNATTPEEKAERREARRALIFMTGSQLALTGAAGSVMAPVAFAILDAFADDDELLSAREQFIQEAPRWMSQGLLSYGLDTSRFGFDTLLPFSSTQRYMPVDDDPRNTVNWLVASSMGPLVGLGQQYYDGLQRLGNGDLTGAMGQFAPALFSDAMSGVWNWGEDTMTRDEVPYYTPSVYERLINMAGLKSGDQAEQRHNMGAAYNGLKRAQGRKSSLLRQLHLASTPAEQREAMEEVANWNRTNPEIPITRETIKGSAMSRQQKIQNATRINIPLSGTDTTLAERLMEGN